MLTVVTRERGTLREAVILCEATVSLLADHFDVEVVHKVHRCHLDEQQQHGRVIGETEEPVQSNLRRVDPLGHGDVIIKVAAVD